MELGLVACVLYHGLNGLRVVPSTSGGRVPAISARCWGRRSDLAAADGPGHRGDRHAHGGAVPVTATFEGRSGPQAPVREKDHDRPASLDNPRSPRTRTGIPNFEKYAWLFMRFSGVVLLFLVVGHPFIGLMGRRRLPHRLQLRRTALGVTVLADLGPGDALAGLTHGGNGMRTIIADYARKDSDTILASTPCSQCRCSSSWSSAPTPCSPSTRTSPRRSMIHEHKYDVVIVGAGGAGMRRGGSRTAGAHRRPHQALPDPQPHRCGPGWHVRRSGQCRRGQLGVAHLRHRQGRGLSRRPGRGRDHVQGGDRRRPRSREDGMPFNRTPRAGSISAGSAAIPATTVRHRSAAPVTPPTAPAT